MHSTKLVCVVFGVTISIAVLAAAVDVTTKYGTVRGCSIDLAGKTIDSFYGIPYAQPPVGSLRFKPPQAPTNWTSTLDGTSPGKTCVQIPINMASYDPGLQSEDCLYLNIHTPTASSIGSPLPVMVWIHGGGYTAGSGAIYNGTGLATRDVIVVTFNYRLDTLGFMSTEDDVMPGNYGMLDQVAALQWVKDNIAAFGGDPKMVTVFGESAGSGSISLLLLSPLTKGLFQGAIMESGSSLNPWAYAHPARAIPHKLATRLISYVMGCYSEDNKEVLQCLQTKDAVEMVNATKLVSGTTSDGNNLMNPRVETTYGFLPDLPLRLLARGQFHHVNTIRGYNHNEFALFDNFNELQKTATVDIVKLYARSAIDQFTIVDKDQIVADLVDYYTYDISSGDSVAYAKAAEEMAADFNFVGGIMNEIDLAAKASIGEKHYLYEFSARPEHSLQPSWVTATHADELQYVFGIPLALSADPQQRNLTTKIMSLWTDFAKTGDPNSAGGNDDNSTVIWKPFEVAAGFESDSNQYKLTMRLDGIGLDKFNKPMVKGEYFGFLQRIDTAIDPKSDIIVG